MSDKWADGDLVSGVNWVDSYSSKTHKLISFGLTVFVFFGIAFFAEYYSTLIPLLALSLLIMTATINFVNEKIINKLAQALIVLTGYVGSVCIIIYANL